MPLVVLKKLVSFFQVSVPVTDSPARACVRLGPTCPFAPPFVNVAEVNAYNDGPKGITGPVEDKIPPK
jgi:hypothetical protein